MKRNILVALQCIALLTFVGCTKGKKQDYYPEIRYPYVSELPTVDPAKTVLTTQANVINLIFDGLLEFHYLKRPYTIKPNLAAELPTIQRKGKKTIYTIKLRQGVTFHPDKCFGEKQTREFTAHDVEYSFKRLVDSKVASRIYPDLKRIWEGAEAFFKASTKSQKTDYSKPMKALKVIDKYTIQITLKEPRSVFLYWLANADFYIVAKEAVEFYGQEFGGHPIGTGPFKLTSWLRKSKLVFEANEKYHGTYPTEGMPEDKDENFLKDAGKQLPLTKKMVWYFLHEPEPMWLKFLKGELDFTNIPRERYGSVVVGDELRQDLIDKGIVARKLQGIISWNMYFNLKHPELSNVHVRRAFMLALDIQNVLDTIAKGKYIMSQSSVPPLLWPTGSGDFKHPYKGPHILKAKEELIKAGYPDGKGLPVFKISTSIGPQYRQWVEIMEQHLANVGIRVAYDGLNTIQWHKVLTEKQFDMLLSGSSGEYPDAETFLSGFYSKNPMVNYSQFENAQYDDWYERILELPLDAKERDTIIAKMMRLLQQELPNMPFFLYNTYTLRYNTIHNYKSNDALWFAAKYWKKAKR